MSYESKYVAADRLAPLLLERLRRSFPPDGEYPVNRVHSVYFDTPALDASAEVDNGDLHKTKVRVRWYEGEDGAVGPAFIECKRKTGTQRRKERLRLSRFEPDLPLHHPAWLALPRTLLQTDEPPPAGLLQPTLHVSYRRHRFVEPTTGLRLALDHEIRAVRVHPRLARIAPQSRRPAPFLVFEAKGDRRDLPPCLHFVHGLGARRRAFSKYGLWNELFP